MNAVFEDMTANVPIIAGLAMGFLHVIQGPDHLAAVTPIAIDSRKKAPWIGISWGLGHTLGALIIGVLFIFFKEVIPVERISHSSEILVGILLIVIGAWGFYKIRNPRKEVHVHRSYRQNLFSALSFGVFHGVAGISHIIAILPTLAFHSKSGSIAYLAGFAAGTIIAMFSYSFILGKISIRSERVNKNSASLLKVVRFGGASFAVIVGIIWLSISL